MLLGHLVDFLTGEVVRELYFLYRQAIRKAIWYLRHALEAMEEMSRGTKHEPDFGKILLFPLVAD